MNFFSNTDKWGKSKDQRSSKQNKEPRSDKGLTMDFELETLDELDIIGDLRGADGIGAPSIEGKTLIFGRYSHDKIYELMAWSGIFEEIETKGYKNYKLELQYLSDLDQRIFVKENDQILIHIRLKISHFRMRLHPGAPKRKLLYIDWLLTQHPRARKFRKDRLFPGQDLPGLGIFAQITDFITNLAIGVGAEGAFNIPEYFHDAMLFHRQFFFYDPEREAFFRAIIRDLRKHGAREISRAFAEERILDHSGARVHWTPGEMISVLRPELEELLWSRNYYTRVVRELKRMKYRLVSREVAKAMLPAEDSPEKPQKSRKPE